MVLAAGDNLALTLGLNLVRLPSEPGAAKWSGHFAPANPTGPIPYLEALTWNPRRILLPAPSVGICWYCGKAGLLTVGPGIVYLKNEETKANKKAGKSVPVQWKDPGAFYREDDYKTAKSSSEDVAMDNRDLRSLTASTSSVVTANAGHHCWLLVVPCTNPANNKTFDHRLIKASDLSPDAVCAMVPDHSGQVAQGGRDGWKVPKPDRARGHALFIHAAARLVTSGEWHELRNAAWRDMHDSPAAFDALAGLYWAMRDKRVGGLPSRNVAWLVLKLMAAVPGRLRALRRGANFNPLEAIPKQQGNGGPRTFRYPVSFPRSQRLEATLRDQLEKNARARNPKPVDWVGLCYGLDELLD